MRQAQCERNTSETQIVAELTIEGQGRADISTGIGFFDHMLTLFTLHGGFDLRLKAHGDLHVDQHHTVEDVGLVLGLLFDQALGDRRGILRSGYFVQTMDEALAVVALDLSGRPVSVYSDGVRARQIGEFTVELLPDFFQAFAQAARANVHVKVLSGRSSHHRVEAIFKCFAKALRFACSTDESLRDKLPSTKGLL